MKSNEQETKPQRNKYSPQFKAKDPQAKAKAIDRKLCLSSFLP